MSQRDRFQWREQQHRAREAFTERVEPVKPPPRLNRANYKYARVPVKELPFYIRHSRKVQIALIFTGVSLFFSKPIYQFYQGYSKPLPLEDVLLHPQSRNGVSYQSSRPYGNVSKDPR